jgi:hypothetical protein
MCLILTQRRICIVIIHTKGNISFSSFDVRDEGIEPSDTLFVRVETRGDGVYELPFVD